jgi:hypothetical protein
VRPPRSRNNAAAAKVPIQPQRRHLGFIDVVERDFALDITLLDDDSEIGDEVIFATATRGA